MLLKIKEKKSFSNLFRRKNLPECHSGRIWRLIRHNLTSSKLHVTILLGVTVTLPFNRNSKLNYTVILSHLSFLRRKHDRACIHICMHKINVRFQ